MPSDPVLLSACISAHIPTACVRRHYDKVGIYDDPVAGIVSPVIQVNAFLRWNFSPYQPRSWESGWSCLGVVCLYVYICHLWIHLQEALCLLSASWSGIFKVDLVCDRQEQLGTHGCLGGKHLHSNCGGSTSLRLLAHEFNFICNFLPFSLKVVLFMFIVGFLFLFFFS